ncbi:MAG: subtilase-type protease inhibitor [Actinomycetota bacterium]|nr:subtilase-type protease inhibitor [Actinomycetota bacterium]
MKDVQLNALRELPPSEACRLIDFEQAEIVTLESFPAQYVLAVKGTAPVFNLRVELLPLTYVRQPEYWGIEVVGCLSGIFLPAERPFSVSLGLAGVTGTQGVEVVGASRSQKLDVPPKEGPLGAFSVSITSKAGELIGSSWLTCSPDGGTHPQPAAACRQLVEADGHIEAIPEDPGPCTEEFNPVVLQASGTWRGESRRFSREFSNPCEGIRATGGVLFNFDDPSSS